MKKLISFKLAGKLLLSIMSLFILFHFLILFNILPADIVWGGKIDSGEDNIFFMELIAILVLFVFLIVIVIKTYYYESFKLKRIINIAVWVIFAYFCLNVLGNLASENIVENAIFAPLTFIMSFFTLRLAINS